MVVLKTIPFKVDNWDKLGSDASIQMQHWATNLDIANLHGLFHTVGILVSGGTLGGVCNGKMIDRCGIYYDDDLFRIQGDK